MTGLIKISEAFSLAYHALYHLASTKDSRPITSAEMAAEFEVSETHLAKVMQRLARAGFVKSKRGPRGGFIMKKDPKDITLKAIHAASDGLLTVSKQTVGTHVCAGRKCALDGVLRTLYKFAYEEFDKITLAQLMRKRR